MRLKISMVLAAVILVMSMAAASYAEETASDDINTVSIQNIYYDVFGLESDEEIYRKYADSFNDRDVVLVMDGNDQKYITALRQFSFHSLELIIEFEDEKSYENLVLARDLLFPDCLTEVTVTCGGEEMIMDNDAMSYFVTALAVCCPGAQLNGEPVSDVYSRFLKNDSYGVLDQYEAYVKMHYIFDLVQNGKLEETDGDPVFAGKLIFLIYDDVEVLSQECIDNDESFGSVPDSYLAAEFDEADTAIYIYPVIMSVGTYSNGTEACCTFTNVIVVDLNSMKMYKMYTAVRNDPPEELVISADDGQYSEEAAVGKYEPYAAVNQILKATGSSTAKVDESAADTEAKMNLLPWEAGGLSQEETSTEAQTTVLEESTAQTSAGTENENEISQEAAVQEQTSSTEGSAAQTETSESTESAAQTETSESTETAAQTETSESTESSAQTEISETTNESAEAEVQTTSREETETETESDNDEQKPYSWMTDDLLEKIFDALGDDQYKTTYNNLKKVADLAYGSKGTAAAGVQNTLIAFGKDITADSSIGNDTLDALNEVQESLGLETTSTISSSIYSQLMPGLLMYLDEEKADEIFGSLLSSDDGDEREYMHGCILRLQGLNYSARQAFEDSKFANYEEMAQMCVQDMPENGEYYRNSAVNGSGSVLTVAVNSYDESAVTAVMIYSADDVLVSCLIIRGSDSASADLPAGTYKIMDGMGYRWYGINEMFGKEGTYEYMLFDGGQQTLELQSGYDYSLTFNVMEHNENSMNVGSESIDWEDIAG